MPLETPRLKMLLSYWYYRKTDLTGEFAKLFKQPPEVFFDSGGFSAFTQGAQIDVADYAAFLHKWEGYAAAYANLDVIGDPDATWANQQALEADGLHPIPVFHVGTDWRWLDHYIERYPYIALGGMVPHLRQYKKLLPWLVRCFRLAAGKSVYHGFGVNTWHLLRDFPWYSVDSSSWGQGFRYGLVPVFDAVHGMWSNFKIGDVSSSQAEWQTLVRLGFQPAEFSDRSRYHQSKAAAVAAASYAQAEQWLRRRHGEIHIPQRASLPGVTVYLVASNNGNMAAADEVGARVYLVDSNIENLASGAGARIYLVGERAGKSAKFNGVEHTLGKITP